MGWLKRRAGELRSVGLETVRPFVAPFTSLARTTWRMIRHPVKFGQFVDEDFHGLTGGVEYLAKAALLITVAIAVTFRWLVSQDASVPDFPFVEIVIAGGLVTMSIVFWLAFAPVFWIFSGKRLDLHAFVAANSYWVGLLLTLIAINLLIVGLVGGIFSESGDGVVRHDGPSSFNVAVQWPGLNELTHRQSWFLAALAAVASFYLAVIVVGTISLWGLVCWLSKAHEVSRVRVVMAMLAFQVCFHSIATTIRWLI